jgi:membrane-associated phospholipid phosphatase
VRRLRRVDERLMRTLTSTGCAALDQTMPRASRLADQLLIWWLIAGLLWAGGDRRSRRAAVRAVVAMLAAGSVSNGARLYVFSRERPPASLSGGRPGRVPDSPGFPSGHSAGAAAFATVLLCEAPRWVGLPVAGLSAAVAYSRVYTGAHYPGDVAAGAVTGIGIALVTCGVRPTGGTRHRRRRSAGRWRSTLG